MAMRGVVAALAASLLALVPAAAAPAWDQVENIKEAAGHIAVLHAKQGPQKAIEFIDACYRTHGLASDYSRAYEGCIVRDFLVAHILAAQYAQVSAEERAKRRLPEPRAIAGSMGQRVAAAFQQYNVTPADADHFRELVGKHGIPVYLNIAFPPTEKAPAEKDGKNGKKKQSRDQ